MGTAISYGSSPNEVFSAHNEPALMRSACQGFFFI